MAAVSTAAGPWRVRLSGKQGALQSTGRLMQQASQMQSPEMGGQDVPLQAERQKCSQHRQAGCSQQQV